jgi:hypothetical protein
MVATPAGLKSNNQPTEIGSLTMPNSPIDPPTVSAEAPSPDLCECDGCEIKRLTAEVERLRAVLEAWDDAVRIDVLMEGPRYMGVDLRRGSDAWEKTKAVLKETRT